MQTGRPANLSGAESENGLPVFQAVGDQPESEYLNGRSRLLLGPPVCGNAWKGLDGMRSLALLDQHTIAVRVKPIACRHRMTIRG